MFIPPGNHQTWHKHKNKPIISSSLRYLENRQVLMTSKAVPPAPIPDRRAGDEGITPVDHSAVVWRAKCRFANAPYIVKPPTEPYDRNSRRNPRSRGDSRYVSIKKF
jgi:hypothetical protein